MALLILAALLAALVIRMLRLPQVQLALAAIAGAGAALATVEGLGLLVVALAVLLAAGVLGPVAILHRFVVPGRSHFRPIPAGVS